jgi:SAM-dependent methyltransferase
MMSATTSSKGSAERWGPLWGARPQDWAANEEQQLPTYEPAIRRAGIGAGHRVLEEGCGSGVFLRAAADCGARVVGIDASAALIDLARARVPEAELSVGDMQFLPYPTTPSTPPQGSTPSSWPPTWWQPCARRPE